MTSRDVDTVFAVRVRGKDGSVGRDAKALEEFDAAYPRLVLVAYRKVGRFFGL